MNRDQGQHYGPDQEIDVEELVEFLARQMVDEPEQVRVHRQGQTLLIRVGEGEEGRLIGRQGRVIQAIRTLARSATPPRSRLTVDLDGPRSAHKEKRRP